MKFLPVALVALAVGADALLTNPMTDIKKVQVYVFFVVVLASSVFLCTPLGLKIP